MRVHGLTMAGALLGGMAMLAGGATQAAYPERPVHILLGFAPGGGTDFMARLVAKKLTEKWGQAVIVENRPGAAGTISEDVVAHSAPDGYTIAWITNTHTSSPSEFKLNYDPVKSFSPVMRVGYFPDILAIHPSLPIHTVNELIAYAKANPGKLNFGSSGPGAPDYIAGAVFMQRAGISMVNVSYKGGGEIPAATMSHEVDACMTVPAATVPLVQTGKLRALAVTTTSRSRSLPDVPTVAEAANLPGYDESVWYGMLLPAGTPKEIVNTLHDSTVAVLNDPEVKAVLEKQDFYPLENTPDDFRKFIEQDLASIAAVSKGSETKK